MQLSHSAICSLDKEFRRNLINGISGYKSVNLIGTKGKSGVSNLALFSSMVHLGADPALQGFVVRPDSVPRHTLENIRETGFFTANHVHEDFLEQAHQTSARYPAEVSEFNATGLDEKYLGDFPAPFVKQSGIKLGLELLRELPVHENNTHFLIAAVRFIEVQDDFISKDGHLDLSGSKTATVSGLDTYSIPNGSRRLGYAKPSL